MSNINDFYMPQPPLSFIEELRSPLHSEKPDWFKRTEKEENEASVNGIYIINNFPDKENLLETAIDDFNLFTKVFEINGKKYPLYLEYKKTDKFEDFIVTVTNDFCKIIAGDTEGIRRGIIYIEDEIQRSEGAFLTCGTIKRTPKVKARITRGFFSPTNRPPKNIDELYDDVDYYPDEYLNRLAHDGTNGLWIYSRLKDLVKTDIIPEFGVGSEKRIAKLNSIITRAKRYGIGVYVFFIDPTYLNAELSKKYPEIAGAECVGGGGNYTFCTNSEKGAAYCIQAMERLAKSIPDAAGYIDISFGEHPTSCASAADYTTCPRCKNYTKGQIIGHTVDLLREGLRRAKVKADFISWTYGYRTWTVEESLDYVHNTPEDVIIMNSFEELGFHKQLGKDRLAVDYWLSYAGPSDHYKITADEAKKECKTTYAKLQVCCSHELATVPYIPVPGLLFDKYSAGFDGVVECWYFGNYPSMMSKAAGELAFLHDFSDKDAFLKHLAGIYFGKSKAEDALKAWKHFEEAYKNYPVNIMFSYYGPMHDGVCWELQLKPKNTPLPRTWLFLDTPDGDRIYECLQEGHTLDEVVILLEAMNKEWQKGLLALPDECPKEMKTVIDALTILFSSGRNIMKFYKLRYELNSSTDKIATLSKMEEIVKAEIQNSEQMIPVCNSDSRLGYHSEAENFKFFPAQLEKRIKSLKELLNSEFVEVKEMIENNITPLNWDIGYSDKTYKMATSLEEAEIVQYGDKDAYFRSSFEGENITIEMFGKKDTLYFLTFETEPMHPQADVQFFDGKKHINHPQTGLAGHLEEEYLKKYKLIYKDEGETERYIVTVNRNDIGWTDDDIILRVKTFADWVDWCYLEDPGFRLCIYKSPGHFGRFIY